MTTGFRLPTLSLTNGLLIATIGFASVSTVINVSALSLLKNQVQQEMDARNSAQHPATGTAKSNDPILMLPMGDNQQQAQEQELARKQQEQLAMQQAYQQQQLMTQQQMQMAQSAPSSRSSSASSTSSNKGPETTSTSSASSLPSVASEAKEGSSSTPASQASITTSASASSSSENARATSSQVVFDAKGVPQSGDPIWDSCIRFHPLLRPDGKPYNCNAYHSGNIWYWPVGGTEIRWDGVKATVVTPLPGEGSSSTSSSAGSSL